MSSARNHCRRSHRSEQRKAGVYRESMRRSYYSAYRARNHFGGLFGILRRRRALQKAAEKRGEV